MEFDVFGMGNALVDMEFAVDDAFLETHGIAKGLMTLVDTERQFAVLQALRGQHGSRACGGSAANTMVAVAALGGGRAMRSWWLPMRWGIFSWRIWPAWALPPPCRGRVLLGARGRVWCS